MSAKRLMEGRVQGEDPENPEWTTGDLARARPASEIHGHSVTQSLVRKRGRPPKAEGERKKQVTLRLSPDVLTAARKTGPGWQARVDQVLRAAFASNRTLSMADLGAAIVQSARGNRSTVIPPMTFIGSDRKTRHQSKNPKKQG